MCMYVRVCVYVYIFFFGKICDIDHMNFTQVKIYMDLMKHMSRTRVSVLY